MLQNVFQEALFAAGTGAYQFATAPNLGLESVGFGADATGTLTREGFQKACAAVGLEVPAEAIDMAYEQQASPDPSRLTIEAFVRAMLPNWRPFRGLEVGPARQAQGLETFLALGAVRAGCAAMALRAPSGDLTVADLTREAQTVGLKQVTSAVGTRILLRFGAVVTGAESMQTIRVLSDAKVLAACAEEAGRVVGKTGPSLTVALLSVMHRRCTLVTTETPLLPEQAIEAFHAIDVAGVGYITEKSVLEAASKHGLQLATTRKGEEQVVAGMMARLGGKRQQWHAKEAVSRVHEDLTVAKAAFIEAIRVICGHLADHTGPALVIGIIEATAGCEVTTTAFEALHRGQDKACVSDYFYRGDARAITVKDIRKSGKELGFPIVNAARTALLGWYDLTPRIGRHAHTTGETPGALSEPGFATAVRPHTWLLRFKTGTALTTAALSALFGPCLGERDAKANLRDAIERGYGSVTLAGDEAGDEVEQVELGLEELLTAAKYVGLPMCVAEVTLTLTMGLNPNPNPCWQAGKVINSRIGSNSLTTRRRCISKRRFGEESQTL